MHCTNCSEEVVKNAEICPHCGVRVFTVKNYCQGCGSSIQEKQEMCIECGVLIKQSSTPVRSSTLEPVLPAILSFFVPGLGQLVMGQIAKGILLFGLSLFISLFTLFFFIGGMLVMPIIAATDAYFIAKKRKEGRSVDNWEFF